MDAPDISYSAQLGERTEDSLLGSNWVPKTIAAIRDSINDLFDSLNDQMKNEVAEKIPVGATGALQKSYTGERLGGEGGNVSTIFGSSVPYAPAVEFGSPPHFPPVAPILAWVEKKLGLGGDEALGVAFAICKTISRRGVAARPVLTEWFENSGAEAAELIEAAIISELEKNL